MVFFNKIKWILNQKFHSTVLCTDIFCKLLQYEGGWELVICWSVFIPLKYGSANWVSGLNYKLRGSITILSIRLFITRCITSRGSGSGEPLHISFEYDLLESSSIAWEIPSVITSVKRRTLRFSFPPLLCEKLSAVCN